MGRYPVFILAGCAMAVIPSYAGSTLIADSGQAKGYIPRCPGNPLCPTAPERDALGVPVVSDPATAPAGANQPIPQAPPGAVWVADPDARAAFAMQPSTGEKPPCSRAITDNCTQTYERAARPRR